MRPRRDVHALALVAAVAAVCTACKKPSEAEGRAAVAAERAAHEHAGVRQRTIDETNDYLAVVRREQLELRARLHERIAEIDTTLAGLGVAPHEARRAVVRGEPGRARTTGAKRVETLAASRRVLEADLMTLELSDERGWDEIKASIERDLEVHGGRGSI